jgi:hypothetical protein
MIVEKSQYRVLTLDRKVGPILGGRCRLQTAGIYQLVDFA